MLGLLVYGVVIEIAQSLPPTCTAERQDWCADSFGILLEWVALMLNTRSLNHIPSVRIIAGSDNGACCHFCHTACAPVLCSALSFLHRLAWPSMTSKPSKS